MSSFLHRQSTRQTLLLIGILLIAANLRAPITVLPTLLDPIRAELRLGIAAAGALTTLPLLAFALLSPFGARFARIYGLERTLLGALILIAIGIALRSADSTVWLYIGTGLIGTGIALGNVLLPSLVKQEFPHNIPALTGAYALAMGVAAALGSAAIVPLAQVMGWRGALASFLLLPLVAVAVWLLQPGQARATPDTTAVTAVQDNLIWRSPLAWQITLFLGLNSTIYYVVITWLPTILVDAGLSAERAGSLHGILQLSTAIPGLILGPLLHRMRDQRLPAVVVSSLSSIALLGFLALPHAALIWSILFGLGTGSGIILGLTFIGLRTTHAHQAAVLSGMSQCIGYLLASAGPMAIGALRDMPGGWLIPLGLCAALALVSVFIGLLAGRDRKIG
ncbi:CynX/NimT family MFS transporter [Alcaligenaceae bacterium SJ-26]|nr:CynX/NimT family MFS transporter [Alcaligenaceae bacterium SJ-26]